MICPIWVLRFGLSIFCAILRKAHLRTPRDPSRSSLDAADRRMAAFCRPIRLRIERCHRIGDRELRDTPDRIVCGKGRFDALVVGISDRKSRLEQFVVETLWDTWLPKVVG